MRIKISKQKVELKNIFFGSIVGLLVIFLTGLIYAYFNFIKPYQEIKAQEQALEEYHQRLLGWQKQQENK
jgi:hypothetical protein